MKIVYFGAGAFGKPTLERLATEHELAAVVTQPDRPAGRRRRLTPTPIAQWASANAPDAPLLKPENVNEPQALAQIRDLDADAWVVIAYGQKLSPALLADRFAINLHASLLPRWRGASPINAAILAGDEQTGNSVITLADSLDAGLIFAQSKRTIDPALTAGELHDLLAGDGPELVLGVLADHQMGTLRPAQQDESFVTTAAKLSRADAWVDFTQSARACRRRIHGLTPWPGAAATLDAEPVKLLRVEPVDLQSEQHPGAIVDADAGVVACAGETALRILDVQPAGRRPMTWDQFARGRRVRIGDCIESGPPC